MSTHIPQKIGLATAIIVSMNAMIGAGIFSVPAALASSVGPAGILTYVFVIIAVWCMALTLARVARAFSQEGSFYIYAQQWGGHIAGILAAAGYLIGLSIAMGLLAQMAGIYLHEWITVSSPTVLGGITLISLIVLNMVGVSLSQAGQIILICCTVFPLIATITICLTNAHFEHILPITPISISALLSSTRAVIFGFFGFECAASLFAIVKNPQRTVPRALTYSILLVGILYLLFVLSIMLAIPLSAFQDPTQSLSGILTQQFPHYSWLVHIIRFSIISAVVGTLHSMVWSSSTLIVSFSKHIPLFKRLLTLFKGNYHQRAVLLMGVAIISSFLTLRSFDLFFSLTALCIVFAYVLSMISAFTLPEQNLKHSIVTLIGLLTAGIIIFYALEGLIQALNT